jgi:hypothetical protein
VAALKSHVRDAVQNTVADSFDWFVTVKAKADARA